VQPLDLIATARILLRAGNGKPTQSNLRRAHSSIYYSLFHCLARCCADTLLGGTGADRSQGAWRQAYRALEHNKTKDACKNANWIKKFPKAIEDFASTFVMMQEKRHAADYDPHIRLSKSEVINDIDFVVETIENFKASSIKDRRAFCAYVLLKVRT
jgi:uncharacterized protein (UPF0332 family)